MNRTITLLLLLIIICSTFVQLIPKVSSQQDYIPSDPYFVGVRYNLPWWCWWCSPSTATYVTATMFIPDGSPEYYLVNFIHYYVLLNVNNYDPNNAPRYWYQLGIDNRFHVVAATYDYGNDRRPLTGDDNFWWCISPNDSNPSYFLNRGEWYRFRIEMDGRTVVFSVQRFVNGVWQNVFEPCRQSYSTSAYLVLDSSYQVFEEVRANQTYERMPTYSFYFIDLGNSRTSTETNWVSYEVSNNPTVNPVPPNAKATIYQNRVLIQNFYNRFQTAPGQQPVSGASATKASSKNTFLVAYYNSWNNIVIGKVTYRDPINRPNKYYVSYEILTITSEKTGAVPSITYSPYTGKYYLAWTGLDYRLNVMQSYDGIYWFNKVTLNEYSFRAPTLVVSGNYIYIIWVGMDDRINVMRSQDGINWFDKSTADELTKYHVGATTYTNNVLVIAWVGLDYRINVIHYYASTKTWLYKVTLNELSFSGVSITVIREPYKYYTSDMLYLVWMGGDWRLNSIRSNDLGINWGHKMTFDESRLTNPFIASNEDKLLITYCWNDLLFLLRTTL